MPLSKSPVSHKCVLSVGTEWMLVEKLLIWWSPEYHSTLLAALVLMGDDESTGECEESSPSSAAAECFFCGLLLAQEWRFAVWLLGTVVTKLCLFPGLHSSQGKLGSRGETNKKAPLSLTLKLLSNTFVFSTQWGYISPQRTEMAERNKC